MSEDIATIICPRVGEDNPDYPFQTYIKQCSKCDEDVRLAHNTLIQAGGDAILICEHCAKEFMQEKAEAGDPVEFQMPSDYVIKELAQATGLTTKQVRDNITSNLELIHQRLNSKR